MLANKLAFRDCCTCLNFQELDFYNRYMGGKEVEGV